MVAHESGAEWIGCRSRNRLARKVASRAKQLTSQWWSVSCCYAGKVGGKHLRPARLGSRLIHTRPGRPSGTKKPCLRRSGLGITMSVRHAGERPLSRSGLRATGSHLLRAAENAPVIERPGDDAPPDSMLRQNHGWISASHLPSARSFAISSSKGRPMFSTQRASLGTIFQLP